MSNDIVLPLSKTVMKSMVCVTVDTCLAYTDGEDDDFKYTTMYERGNTNQHAEACQGGTQADRVMLTLGR